MAGKISSTVLTRLFRRAERAGFVSSAPNEAPMPHSTANFASDLSEAGPATPT